MLLRLGIGDLGLPVSRSIVQAHWRRLWVEERVHGRAAFHFTAPVWKGDTLRATAE